MSDDPDQRELIVGCPEPTWCNNSVKTAKYSMLSFFPVVGNGTVPMNKLWLLQFG